MKRKLFNLPILLFTFLVLQLTFAQAFAESTIYTTTDPSTCEKTNQCFAFSYKGYEVSADGKTVTLSFKIQTNCNHDLSYAAFEIPTGTTATATGTRKYNYKTSITNNPFSSIKFEGSGISGYKNGVSDEFKYVISKAAFDKLTTIRVQAKASTTVGTVSFDKDCNVPKCVVSAVAITNVKYVVAGVTYTPTSSTYISTLQKVVQQGKPVKVCFTVAASAGYKTYSLVSYKSPYATFVRAEAHRQEVFDYKTITVGPDGGTFCLEVNVPDCFFQVDFVKGCIIERLGPANTNNFYGDQGRLIAYAQGGKASCVPDKPLGNEGCTPGYWKQDQHFGNWAPAVPTGTNATKFFDVFNVCDQSNNNCNYQGLPANLTLLEALKLQGGGFSSLARHAAAAYLSASSKDVEYGLTKNAVITGVINAFKTGNLAIKAQLEEANEKYCPLGRSLMNARVATQDTDKFNAQEKQETKLTAYPSPFSNTATIEFKLNKTEDFTVKLHDMQGRLVKQLKTGTAKAGEQNQVEVDGRGLADGLYLVKLVTQSEAKTVKLVYKK